MSLAAKADTHRVRRRVFLAVRLAVLLALGYVAFLVVSSNSAELSGSASYLGQAKLIWILPALACETLSYAAFMQLQRRLLAAGRLHTNVVPMAAITMAGNAMNNSLPGGGAFATVFAYRQFRRRGADEALTTWTIVAFTALTSITLALIALVGLVVAGDGGPVAGLWPFIPLLVLGPVLGVFVLLRPRILGRVLTRPLQLVRRVTTFPRAEPVELVERMVARLETVTPRRRDWLAGLVYSMANWLTDCACLIFALVAVGASIPWRGILVAYGAAQVASNLPITPGGLGVVEGSLTIALVAYGGSTEGTVAAVLLYRIMSFWAPLPIGWLSWVGLQIEARRHPMPETGIVAELEAEEDAEEAEVQREQGYGAALGMVEP